MQYSMQVFEDADHDQFRVMDRDGEPWFILSEVCRKLEIVNPRDAASRLDDDEKDAVGIADAIGREQKSTIINESGLYSLILTSRKEAAKKFKKWVTGEVLPAIRKTGGYRGKIPAFIRRYNDNWDRVDAGHFSVLNELVVHLWGRLEHAGRIMADKALDGTENRPDVSVGRCFSDWLKINHPEVSVSFSYYIHKTPEWEGEVRQYPFALLPLFREYLDSVWIPNRAEGYLKTRDPASLPYLQKLLIPPSRPKAGMMRTPRTMFRRKAI
jgi:prophage antirepressor-like protein